VKQHCSSQSHVLQYCALGLDAAGDNQLATSSMISLVASGHVAFCGKSFLLLKELSVVYVYDLDKMLPSLVCSNTATYCRTYITVANIRYIQATVLAVPQYV